MVMQLSRFDMGMLSSKDGGVDAAVRALRLNHLENLREVKTLLYTSHTACKILLLGQKFHSAYVGFRLRVKLCKYL